MIVFWAVIALDLWVLAFTAQVEWRAWRRRREH